MWKKCDQDYWRLLPSSRIQILIQRRRFDVYGVRTAKREVAADERNKPETILESWKLHWYRTPNPKYRTLLSPRRKLPQKPRLKDRRHKIFKSSQCKTWLTELKNGQKQKTEIPNVPLIYSSLIASLIYIFTHFLLLFAFSIWHLYSFMQIDRDVTFNDHG